MLRRFRNCYLERTQSGLKTQVIVIREERHYTSASIDWYIYIFFFIGTKRNEEKIKST